ncbi:hypothetical protein [Brachybacterium sp. YJGR34]|uniref:hypothetical protein n=1 Tax=Brachybacterium sp. YJGR34 TaxID=2059911 RepID=UPI000E09F4E9|nr:hypothetical protein [Brachybacterium sp. YJGR34]
MSPSPRSQAARTLPRGWSAAQPGTAELRAPLAEPPPAAAGRSRAARPAIALLGSLALLLALVTILPRVLMTGGGPEQAVRDYLDALVAGDAQVVRAHLEARDRASSAAITDEILAGATERVIDYRITAVERSGDAAVVTALLETGTAARTSTFTLTARSAGSFSPVTWELDPVIMPLQVVLTPTAPEELIINGVTLPVADLAGFGSGYGRSGVLLQLPPGAYVLSLPEADALRTPVPARLEVPPTLEHGRHVETTLSYDLSASGRKEVIADLEAQLEECARSTSPQPVGCPFGVVDEQGAVIRAGEGTWTVTPPDTYRFTPWVADAWSVAGEDGRAVFTPKSASAGEEVEARIVTFPIGAVSRPDGGGALRTELLHVGRGAGSGCHGTVIEVEDPQSDGTISVCEIAR